MPTRPMPRNLVRRLSSASGTIARDWYSFGNQDHRMTSYQQVKIKRFCQMRGIIPGQTNIRGIRLNAQQYPGYGRSIVVIKRSHHGPGAGVINAINEAVERHNELSSDNDYELLKPYAYDIGNNLIAMHYTNKPSVDEINGIAPTVRGKGFFKKLMKKHGVTLEKLREAAARIQKASCTDKIRSGFAERNLLLLGVRKGKLVFMPLVDLE